MNETSPKDTDREVRVFISSTFKDMMKERDYLIKEVFPEIRHRCHQRGIEFTEIDLRWGITEKQAQQGKVIEVCLKEIDRCRPFFIGMIGERYGWVPKSNEYEKHKKILEDYPWIKDDIKKRLSITEIETQYGALRKPSLSEYAQFYIRKPETPKRVEKEIPSPKNDNRISKFKNIILEQKQFPVDKFRNTEELRSLILENLWAAIEKSFPTSIIPDPLEQTRLEHTSFLRSRLRVYIGGQKYINKLNNFVKSEGHPLIITGESGLGKSALLANWISQYQKENPKTYILYHFIGGAPDSTDYIQIIRRLIEELKLRFQIKDEIPNEPKELIKSFPQFLAQTGRDGKWILVLDALNHLENINKAHLLNWIPDYFPPFIRVIFSSLPGSILNIIKKRNYKIINVKPLSILERKTLIKKYLAQFGKSLPEKTINIITKTKGFQNPLLLRTFLDEIRVFGEYEKLEKRISYYLRSTSPVKFFNSILIRMEKDYEKERKGIVSEFLSLIWASRKGLTESELLEIADIPPLYWSTLYNSLESHLIRRDGLLNFFHDFISKAIESYYLNNDESIKKLHNRLAKYFSKELLSKRCLEELPHHLEQAKQWKKLKDYLTNIEVFLKLYENDEYELLNYWRSLGNLYDMGREYSISVKNFFNGKKTKPIDKTRIFDSIGKFLILNAKYKIAEEMLEQSLKIKKRTFGINHPDTAETIFYLAELLEKQDRYLEAEKLYKQALKIKKETLGLEHPDTIKNINSLAWLYEDQGRYSEAKPLSQRAIDLSKKVLGSNHLDTAFSLNCLASVYIHQGNYKDSILLFKRALEIREKKLGTHHPLTANSYGNLGYNYQIQGHFKKAETLFEHALKIYEKILGPKHYQTAKCINNLAGNYYYQDRFQEAETLYKRHLSISKRIYGPKHHYTAKSMNDLAILYKEQGRYTEAEQSILCAIKILEKALGSEHPDTIIYFENLAELYYVMGDYEKAEHLHMRALIIREKILGSKHPDTATSLYNLALLYKSQAKYDDAESFGKRALSIRGKTLGLEHPVTMSSMDNLADIYYIKCDYSKSELLYKKTLSVRERTIGSEHPDTATNLNNLANLYRDQDKFHQAEPLYKRALSLYRKLFTPKHPYTAMVLNNLAKLYTEQGQYKKAEILFNRAQKITIETLGSKHPGVAKILNNLGILYTKQGKFKEAEKIIGKSLLIRETKLGEDHAETADTIIVLANLMEEKGNLKKALELYKKAYKIYEIKFGKTNQQTVSAKKSMKQVQLKIKN